MTTARRRGRPVAGPAAGGRGQRSRGAFDHAYARAMVQDHQEDLRLYQEEAANGTDPDVKAFAARHVPLLQEH